MVVGTVAFWKLEMLIYNSQMVFLDRSNRKLEYNHKSEYVVDAAIEARTISVASTRVPTIFSRTLVFFSII